MGTGRREEEKDKGREGGKGNPPLDPGSAPALELDI